jgi:hypothetical protein
MENTLGFNRLSSPGPVPTSEGVAPTPPTSAPTPNERSNAEAPASPSKVHAQRRRSAAVIAVIAVIAILMYANRTPAPVSSPAEAASAAASASPTLPTAQNGVLALMVQAQSYYTAHESYVGFAPTLSPGAKVSPAGQGIVISDDLGGVCAYAGMLNSTVSPVYIDPTAIACSQASLGAPKTVTSK